MEFVSGLAGEIRTSLTSEQFDLGGYTEIRVRDLVIGAFSSPLDAPTEMVRFTFVVGGGKLIRSRYADDLPKWMTTALRDTGFVEDRSAACAFECQGTFKQQHDTGQNLKTIIVFPRVACANVISQSSSNKTAEETAVNTNSPEYVVMACELATLKDIVNSKLPSWRQRKRLLKIISDGSEYFKTLEEKLIRGEPLSLKEQLIYDANTGHDSEKIAWLQSDIKRMVDDGQLTVSEKEELSQSLAGNITSVAEELEKAKEENKPKRIEKIEEKLALVKARKCFVDAVTPIIHRLKHADDILKIRLKILPLIALEDKGRSMSLTLADLKSIEEKSDFEATVVELEAASRGWFLDDSEFEAMCQAEEKAAKAKYAAKVKALAQKKSANSGAKSGGSSSSAGWSSVGAVKKKPSSNSSTAKKAGAGGFAAAFGNDSDSDD